MRLILRGICCNWIALFSLKTIAIYSLLLHKQVLIKAILIKASVLIRYDSRDACHDDQTDRL